MRNTMGGPSAGACSYTSPHVPSSPTMNCGQLAGAVTWLSLTTKVHCVTFSSNKLGHCKTWINSANQTTQRQCCFIRQNISDRPQHCFFMIITMAATVGTHIYLHYAPSSFATWLAVAAKSKCILIFSPLFVLSTLECWHPRGQLQTLKQYTTPLGGDERYKKSSLSTFAFNGVEVFVQFGRKVHKQVMMRKKNTDKYVWTDDGVEWQVTVTLKTKQQWAWTNFCVMSLLYWKSFVWRGYTEIQLWTVAEVPKLTGKYTLKNIYSFTSECVALNWPVMSCQTTDCRCSSEHLLHAASAQPHDSDTSHLTHVALGHPNKQWRCFSGWHGPTPYLSYLRRNKQHLLYHISYILQFKD